MIQLNTPRNAMLQHWLQGAAFLCAQRTIGTLGGVGINVGMKGRPNASVAYCLYDPQCGELNR